MFVLPPSTASTSRRLGFTRSTLLLLVFGATCLQSIADGQKCGRSPSRSMEMQVIEADDVDYLKYPWYVALTDPSRSRPYVALTDPLYSEPYVLCGGSLISSSHVLTAAHCFKSTGVPLTRKYKLVYKLVDTCVSYRSVAEFNGPQASAVTLHPQYTYGFVNHDIAIITLERTVSLTPACLPPPGSQVSGEGVVIGFGVYKLGVKKNSCKLQEATLPMFTNAQCVVNPLLDKIHMTYLPKTFCAGGSSGGQRTCTGDSGGPLLSQDKQRRYTIRGITSFGYGCYRVYTPTVFTNVAAYIDWIQSVMSGRNGQRGTDSNKMCYLVIVTDGFNIVCETKTYFLRVGNIKTST